MQPDESQSNQFDAGRSGPYGQEPSAQAALSAVRAKYEDDLLAREGVTGVGTGLVVIDGELTGEWALTVYVEPGHPVRAEVPPMLDGAPVHVVEARFELLGPPQSAAVEAPADTGGPETAQERPTPEVQGLPLTHWVQEGGISVGSRRTISSGGTLGLVAIDMSGGPHQGGPMLLSNAHVLAMPGAEKGDEILQPAGLGARVGKLSRWRFGGTTDAAVAEQTDRDFDWSIRHLGAINGVAKAVPGMRVRKSGETTGVTSGIITSVDSSVSFWGEVLRDQIAILGSAGEDFLDAGDSGSVIVNDKMQVVGLACAVTADNRREGWANKIQNVTKALEIAIPRSGEVLSILEKVTLTESTSSAPVLGTAPGRRLVVAWAGRTDKRLNLMTSTDGRAFEGKVTYDDTSALGEPGLVIQPAGSARPDYLAWTEFGSNDLILGALLPDWSGFAYRTRLPFQSGSNVALAQHDGRLILAWKQTDTSITMAASDDGGRSFGAPATLGISSSGGPALARLEESLVLLWEGVDLAPTMAQVFPTNPPEITSPTVLANERSMGHPALGHAGANVLAWTGTDLSHTLNAVISTSEFDFRHQVVLDDQSSAAPSLATYQEFLYLAWAGSTDQAINIGRIGVPRPR